MEALRKAFDAKFPNPSTQFDEVDIRRLHESDKLATAFLSANDGNVEDAVVQIEKSFSFRREMDLNHVCESNFPMELLQKGSIYYRNKDKKGNKILYIRIKDNVKKDAAAAALLKLYIAYLIEKEHLIDQSLQLVMLFDMSGAGLSNFDADLVRYIITCFDTYFPRSLAYLLVFDMPFILNAAWKLIRSWLSEKAREKVIFVKQNNITQYIDQDQLWSHMGGLDNYEYVYEPPPCNSDSTDNMDVLNSSDSHTECRKRKHNLSETESLSSSLTRSLPSSFMPSPNHSSSFNNVSNNVTPSQFRLIITPSDHLHFLKHEDTRSLTLRNPMSRPVAFKVNTTRPQDFRVRPSSGLLQPQEQIEVSVSLKPGDSNLALAGTARFQILGIQVAPETGRQEAVTQLKSAGRESLFEARLSCFTGPKPPDPQPEPSTSELNNQIKELRTQQQQVMTKLDSVFYLLRILCGLVAALIFFHVMRFGYNGSATPLQCQSTNTQPR